MAKLKKSAKADPQALIEKAFAGELEVQSAPVKAAILGAIKDLDSGRERVASRDSSGQWQVNEWLKKAILLYFKISKISPIKAGQLGFLDKIPVKKWTGKEGVRVVPPAVVRTGSFVAAGCVVMPSYVNIGAYVGEGSMVDTWATVGSCAQVGSGVHISGGVGLGGVLEPVQANPVIIEDHAFLGSRCIIVEGVRVEEGAVIAAGVTLTASTKIIDVTGGVAKEWKGFVPRNSVVIPGTVPKEFAAGTFGVTCALVIGQRTESTDRKTSLNQTLRDFNLSV
ncbi:MAG: 2,3,4,5-tetrahydropyridine-2,6-dicarboxylate N-succinyltransferase [Bdellovibrionia bacterium]